MYLPGEIVYSILTCYNKDDLEMCCPSFNDNNGSNHSNDKTIIWALQLRLVDTIFKRSFEKCVMNHYSYPRK